MSPSNAETVRACFDAYRNQDRAAVDRLLAEDLMFTSPQDDHIDKVTYLERCFPTADRFRTQDLMEVVETGDEGVFILYEYELRTGERYRNAEYHTVRDGRIAEIQVFVGGAVRAA